MLATPCGTGCLRNLPRLPPTASMGSERACPPAAGTGPFKIAFWWVPGLRCLLSQWPCSSERSLPVAKERIRTPCWSVGPHQGWVPLAHHRTLARWVGPARGHGAVLGCVRVPALRTGLPGMRVPCSQVGSGLWVPRSLAEFPSSTGVSPWRRILLLPAWGLREVGPSP